MKNFANMQRQSLCHIHNLLLLLVNLRGEESAGLRFLSGKAEKFFADQVTIYNYKLFLKPWQFPAAGEFQHHSYTIINYK
jgi:hypothetical protein